jgi:hypothetical protein
MVEAIMTGADVGAAAAFHEFSAPGVAAKPDEIANVPNGPLSARGRAGSGTETRARRVALAVAV